MIIGLTGKNAAGKGETAKYLQKKGFIYYSLSDIIREEATKRKLEHSRDNLINLGNELRKEYGSSYLAQQINNKILNTKKLFSRHASERVRKRSSLAHKPQKSFFVIDSIRNPYEVRELMKNNDFILVGISAPIELRFERLLKRNRLGDAKTLGEFKQQEEKENLKSDTNQQLDETFKLAKVIIINDSSLEELHKKIDDLLKEINLYI